MMQIDIWGLGLQAVNVLILVWLLSRVFWRPVAAAITRRQETVSAMINKAEAQQAKAAATLAETTQARDGITAERREILEAARAEAETASKATLAQARTTADQMITAANDTIRKQAVYAQKAHDLQATDLSLQIAATLLARLNGPIAQSAFLAQLLEAIGKMPQADRAALLSSPKGIEVVCAAQTTGTAQKTILKKVQTALGGTPDIRFAVDPDLIGGIELRSPHFVLHNSWKADLQRVRKAVKNAG
ncbi:MAG: F0F1 ATP synthase subunit delta [Sulfitobacter sp.]|jgi:F-type H+-transporting ATPase subunit b|nr:F0F1 ATP synthase subunit delta [Sulfitobacter sp.]